VFDFIAFVLALMVLVDFLVSSILFLFSIILDFCVSASCFKALSFFFSCVISFLSAEI